MDPDSPRRVRPAPAAGRWPRRSMLRLLGGLGAGGAFSRGLVALADGQREVTAEMIRQAEWISGQSFDDDERSLMLQGVNDLYGDALLFVSPEGFAATLVLYEILTPDDRPYTSACRDVAVTSDLLAHRDVDLYDERDRELTEVVCTIPEGTVVRAVDFRIAYDPALLSITDVVAGAGVPAGSLVIVCV